MSAAVRSRGRIWLEALADGAPILADALASVLTADAALGDQIARFLAVVPDPTARFPRARNGEVGLEEGWELARRVREVVDGHVDGERRPIVAVVDVPSQAYGRREELMGIHLACAAASDAYATARLAGHPVIAVVVGHALSGGFLAHGYQANRILALDAPDVMVHAMGKDAAARVTRRSIAQLDELAARVLPLAYDVRSYAQLGLLHRLIEGVNADQPSPEDLTTVREALVEAVADARAKPSDLRNRLASLAARDSRAASILVRERLAAQWG